MIRVGFDIGGVLTKYPDIFKPMIEALMAHPEFEVHVLTDVEPKRAARLVVENGYSVPPERIHSCDRGTYGDACKAVKIKELGIDLMLDDYPPYLETAPGLRLLVLPDPARPFFSLNDQGVSRLSLLCFCVPCAEKASMGGGTLTIGWDERPCMGCGTTVGFGWDEPDSRGVRRSKLTADYVAAWPSWFWPFALGKAIQDFVGQHQHEWDSRGGVSVEGGWEHREECRCGEKRSRFEPRTPEEIAPRKLRMRFVTEDWFGSVIVPDKK